MSSLAGSVAYDYVVTPIGTLILGASPTALQSLVIGEPSGRYASGTDGHPVLTLAKQQLHEYFAGTRKTFDLPLCMEGTLFQKRAWAALQQIPYGETVSYKDQATMMGETSKSSRAVGGANGRNPISIIVPCHRVVRKGSLGGYAGGLHVKQYLLDLESSFKQNFDIDFESSFACGTDSD